MKKINIRTFIVLYWSDK